MSGIELFNIVKADSRFNNVPVIFLTANTDMESKASAFKIGVDDYIRKPINEIILLTRIRMHLELVSLRKAY